MRLRASPWILASVWIISCGSSEDSRRPLHDRDDAGDGGGSGGRTGSGGAKATGGTGTGNVSVDGGQPPTGGSSGAPASGGTGGAPASGGSDAGIKDASVPPPDSSITDSGTADAHDSSAGSGGSSGFLPDGGCEPTSDGSAIELRLSQVQPERVTSLRWRNAEGVFSPNVVGEGGPLHCTDFQEFFGMSQGAPEGALPAPIVAGHAANVTECGEITKIVSAPQGCSPLAAQLPTTTEYTLANGARSSQVRVIRTFGFDANSTAVPTSTVGLKPYIARVSLNQLRTVIYPKGDGTVVQIDAQQCPGDCFIPAAAGSTYQEGWFANVNLTTGLAMIVMRDATNTQPVKLTVNYDSFSNANISAFVMVPPAGGWKSEITEIEYLCFADLTTWPQAQRDTGTLPSFCGPATGI